LATGGANFLSNRLGSGFVQVSYSDRGTGPGEAHGIRAADAVAASAGAGHDSDFVVEAELFG
jgi:hypothetical protein